MYEQSLPPSPDSIESAAIWARNTARAFRPEIADSVQQVTALLVEQALRRSPSGERIHITIQIIDDGLAVQVSDPGRHDPDGGTETADLSRITPWFEAIGGPNGHRVRAELRVARTA